MKISQKKKVWKYFTNKREVK